MVHRRLKSPTTKTDKKPVNSLQLVDPPKNDRKKEDKPKEKSKEKGATSPKIKVQTAPQPRPDSKAPESKNVIMDLSKQFSKTGAKEKDSASLQKDETSPSRPSDGDLYNLTEEEDEEKTEKKWMGIDVPGDKHFSEKKWKGVAPEDAELQDVLDTPSNGDPRNSSSGRGRTEDQDREQESPANPDPPLTNNLPARARASPSLGRTSNESSTKRLPAPDGSEQSAQPAEPAEGREPADEEGIREIEEGINFGKTLESKEVPDEERRRDPDAEGDEEQASEACSDRNDSAGEERAANKRKKLKNGAVKSDRDIESASGDIDLEDYTESVSQTENRSSHRGRPGKQRDSPPQTRHVHSQPPKQSPIEEKDEQHYQDNAHSFQGSRHEARSKSHDDSQQSLEKREDSQPKSERVQKKTVDFPKRKESDLESDAPQEEIAGRRSPTFGSGHSPNGANSRAHQSGGIFHPMGSPQSQDNHKGLSDPDKNKNSSSSQKASNRTGTDKDLDKSPSLPGYRKPPSSNQQFTTSIKPAAKDQLGNGKPSTSKEKNKSSNSIDSAKNDSKPYEKSDKQFTFNEIGSTPKGEISPNLFNPKRKGRNPSLDDRVGKMGLGKKQALSQESDKEPSHTDLIDLDIDHKNNTLEEDQIRRSLTSRDIEPSKLSKNSQLSPARMRTEETKKTPNPLSPAYNSSTSASNLNKLLKDADRIDPRRDKSKSPASGNDIKPRDPNPFTKKTSAKAVEAADPLFNPFNINDKVAHPSSKPLSSLEKPKQTQDKSSNQQTKPSGNNQATSSIPKNSASGVHKAGGSKEEDKTAKTSSLTSSPNHNKNAGLPPSNEEPKNPPALDRDAQKAKSSVSLEKQRADARQVLQPAE